MDYIFLWFIVDVVSEEVVPLNSLLELSKKLISETDITKLLDSLNKLTVSKRVAVVLQNL